MAPRCGIDKKGAYIMNRNNVLHQSMVVERRKQYCVFLLAMIANIAPLGLCFFYSLGATLLYLGFPPIHFFLFWLNNKCAKTWLQVITLGLFHILVTAFTHLQCDWLYRHYICDDMIGRAIGEGLCVIGTGIATVLTVVNIVKFYRKQKEYRKANFAGMKKRS